MNAPTIIGALIVTAIFSLIISFEIKKRKSGRGGCPGCSGCPGSGMCPSGDK